MAIIFKKDQLYKHCQYCGKIYDPQWQTPLYDNGQNPLPEALFPYKISTGVGPCCTDVYEAELREIQDG